LLDDKDVQVAGDGFGSADDPVCVGMGEDGALEAFTEFAETIDQVAKRIEAVLLVGAEQARQEPTRSLAA
jgi:hypothetical protein